MRIRFSITGTTPNRIHLPDLVRMAGGMLKGVAGIPSSPADTSSGILGLFENKKSP